MTRKKKKWWTLKPNLFLPPSFSHKIYEETLCDNQHPFVLWAILKICLPENPGNVASTVFNCLADLIEAAGEEDKQFAVYLYHLSTFKQVSNLSPPSIVDTNGLPKEVDEWLQSFSQAKHHTKGGNVYASLLIGLSIPFHKFIKKEPQVP